MKQHRIRVSQVFVPGGFPEITYISREEHKLEEHVNLAQDNLNKLLVVTGPTKSGKTVLVDRIFPQENSIWIDGGTINDEQSFWDSVIEKLNVFTSSEYTESDGNTAELQGALSVEGNLFVAKGGATAGAKTETSNTITLTNARNVNSKIVAINALKAKKIPLIVDDFHYISKPIQKNLVRALKAPIMRGLPVIFIAIPNRRYDAVEVEREMTERTEHIEMPIWSENELANIAKRGFNALEVKIGEDLIQRLTGAAYGSPFLMQEFCKSLCTHSEIEEKMNHTQYISSKINEVDVFTDIAEHSGRSMFEKLKRGPRARKDRIPRLLTDGTTTDIYGVVMSGLKSLHPGVESLSYDSLRLNIKSIMADNPPQRNEISRVLDKIAEISYTDSSSTPVIDWQKDDDTLTITDPFFAFFLKWAR